MCSHGSGREQRGRPSFATVFHDHCNFAYHPWGRWVERQGRESAECRAVGFVAVAEHEMPALLQLARCRRGAVPVCARELGTADGGTAGAARRCAARGGGEGALDGGGGARARCAARHVLAQSPARPPRRGAQTRCGPAGAAAPAGRAAPSADVSPRIRAARGGADSNPNSNPCRPALRGCARRRRRRAARSSCASRRRRRRRR